MLQEGTSRWHPERATSTWAPLAWRSLPEASCGGRRGQQHTPRIPGEEEQRARAR